MYVVALLLVVGLIALGLPTVTHRDQKRFWHPWLNSGLVPLLAGLALAPQLGDEFQPVLRALLALALTAGGILIGTQLRFAYLSAAGGAFLAKHTKAALGAWLTGLLAVLAAGLLFADDPLDGLLACLPAALVLAPLALTTAQTPPMASTGFGVRHRDVVLGHIAPAGWWNLLGLSVLALAVTVLHEQSVGALDVLPLWARLLVEAVIPLLCGLLLGWLASLARNRDEAYMFLLAMLASGAGWALFAGSSALFVGMVTGAAFINISLGRAAIVERVVEQLEQPVAISVGLFAGLAVVVDMPEPVLWVMVLGLVLVRWWSRGRASPTAAALAGRRERQLTTSGAAGVLAVGCLAEWQTGLQGAVLAVAAALVLQTLVAEIHEIRLRRGLADG